MGLDKGHKLKEVTKGERFEIRMTEEQFRNLDECSKELNVSRTEVLLKGLELVKEQIKKTV